MKKGFIVIALFCLILLLVILYNYNNFNSKQKEIISFNNKYLEFNKDEVKGLDITTINDNEKNNIQRNENEEFIEDEENSIKIFLKMKIDGKTYSMESFEKRGMDEFAQYFGGVVFKCIDVTYHKNSGRIATMTFEALQE